MTYRHFMNLYGLSFEETVDLLGSTDGALWYHKETDCFVLLFNDELQNVGRIRWTIAHELGHYTLKHHQYSGADIISRSKVQNDQYKILEQEANYFAKRLLAPYPVVVGLLRRWHRITRHDMEWLFGLSYEAAGYYIAELNKRSRGPWGIVSDGHLLDQFESYLDAVCNLGLCSHCELPMNVQLHTVCPSCGGEIIPLDEPEMDQAFDLLCDGNPMTRLLLA